MIITLFNIKTHNIDLQLFVLSMWPKNHLEVCSISLIFLLVVFWTQGIKKVQLQMCYSPHPYLLNECFISFQEKLKEFVRCNCKTLYCGILWLYYNFMKFAIFIALNIQHLLQAAWEFAPDRELLILT